MQKITVLETVSYPQRRVKLGKNWYPIDPFLELNDLKFGKEYEVEFKLEKGAWYVDSLSLHQEKEQKVS